MSTLPKEKTNPRGAFFISIFLPKTLRTYSKPPTIPDIGRSKVIPVGSLVKNKLTNIICELL
jgi:hypothetical protein